MDKFDFGLRLARLRVAKQVSARDMSLRLGQNPTYINSIETGKSQPSMENFFHICEFLGVSNSEFFDDENKEPEKFRELSARIKRLSIRQLAIISAIVNEFLKEEKTSN